jgi:hypothetical protein
MADPYIGPLCLVKFTFYKVIILLEFKKIPAPPIPVVALLFKNIESFMMRLLFNRIIIPPLV